MLYVFHVETGTMMTFDMNLAMEKVANLQTVIAKGCRVPEDKQVLLISGGESLDHDTVVGKYHAGTDTNPIFLFSKSTIESSIPPSPSVNYGSDIDLQDQVEGSLLMPPAYETVVSRAQLALQFQDVDKDELRACEHLILDQHLQQQGWAAVVANLEDVTSELHQRSETFHDTYQQYLENREGYKELISCVSESLLLLSKIPVLPSLVTSSDAMKGDCSASDDSNSSLYDWIESQDPNHTLHDMVEQCGKSTEQLDQKVDEALCSEVEQLMKEVQNDSMKEVKGLEDRLYGLDQIISGAKKIVQEQAELAQGFVQNQNRLSNLRDRSILPDLCSSHRNQLIEMMKNHSRLREIKKKCRMAKEELSVNLHTRLRWVMYVEKKICDVDGKLTIYLGNLRRLRKRVDILQQVQDAPKVYAQLVIEVVRRKKFSGNYLSWATSLAEDSGQLHEDEVQRRESFLRLIGHHFLQPMFHGLEDYPPPFATEAPDLFDNNLPEVTPDDIKQLRDAVPELSHVLSDPAKDEFVIAPRSVPPDSSVKWEDSAELGLKVPRIPRRVSGCRSDSEALHDDQSPYSIEGGSISLGDQFLECKVEIDPLVHKPGFDSASPPDTEFLLPKSLSEELTLEMKDSEGGLKSPLSAAVEGAKTKETVSVTSIVGPACKPGRTPSRKSLTDNSPDLETSQEFTTADFYFDESMPSSIESPPKTCSDKTNLEQCVLAEKQQNLKLQQQVKEYGRKLNQNEKTLKMLKQFLDTKIPSLTDSAKELKKDHEEHVQSVIKDFENIRDNVIQQVQSFESEIAEKSQTEIDKVNTEKKEIEKLLNEKSQQSMELEKSVDELNEEIKEKDKKHKAELDECKDRFESEIKELNQKHELELEVELDKVRAEYDEKIDSLEKEIEAKELVIKEKESAIKKFETDIIKIEETLTDKFQTEKAQICDILGVEYEQKLEKEVGKHVEEMKQSVVADLTEKHKKEQTQQLDELKQCLIAEKQEAVEMTQSTLTDEHSKGLEDIKNKLMDERRAEIEEIRREMDSKCQEDIAKLSSEFNKEKESLVEELNVYKNKQSAVIEIQTLHSMFGTSDVESQSEPTPVHTDTQAQTDTSLQQTSSMQTDSNDQSHLAVQTESVLTKSSTNQTDKTLTVESSVQPDSIHGVEVSIQTDTCDNDCDNTDSETSVCESVKTETDRKVTSDDKILDAEEVRRTLQAEHEEKLALLEQKHTEEIDRLIAQIEKEKGDAQQLKSSLTSMTGNQQTKFNEAVNRVSREKDSKIEDLKVREMKMCDEIKKLKDQVEQLSKEKSKAEDVKERALSFLKDKEAILHQMETELEDARKQSNMDQVNIASPDAEVVVEETMQSVSDIVSAEEPSLQQKIKTLESMVKSKEEEISKLTQKVMELSMTSSTRSLVQDKVSITSCHVGDLVLLCLDERLDQYVVFTVGTTLHFLHTECLSPLGLKTEAGEAKKQWLIAEVVDKEYCQAKKSNNRFKVPVGTKFYRVKAKRWTREANPSPVKKSDTASGSS